MFRRVVLVIVAIVVSHSLAALSGYILFMLSSKLGEATLSLIARFVVGPGIAILSGALIGLLSRDHPGVISTLGLAPLWVFNLLSSDRPTWASLVPGFAFIAFGAIAAQLVSRLRHQSGSRKWSSIGTGSATP